MLSSVSPRGRFQYLLRVFCVCFPITGHASAVCPEGAIASSPGRRRRLATVATSVKSSSTFFLLSPQLHLAQNAVLLGIPKDGLDELAGDEAQVIARMPRRAAVDTGGAVRGVLGDVRGHVDAPAAFDEGAMS